MKIRFAGRCIIWKGKGRVNVGMAFAISQEDDSAMLKDWKAFDPEKKVETR